MKLPRPSFAAMRAAMRAALRAALFWTVGLPIALTGALKAGFGRFEHVKGMGLGFVVATGILGAAGLRLYRKPVRAWWCRWPLRCMAWFLCLAGLIWLVRLGGLLALVLCVPLVVGTSIEAAFDPPPGAEGSAERYRRWGQYVFGAAAFVALPTIQARLGPGFFGPAIPLALIGPPLVAGAVAWANRAGHANLRLALATGLMGAAGPRLLRKSIGRWWLRWPARCAAWFLCLYQSLAFCMYGWTLAPFLAYWVLCLPIAMTDVLEKVYAKVAGEDWCAAGFRLATGLVGALGLWLYTTAFRRWWVRWPARWLAWPLCLLGLLWFYTCGWWAFFLVPYLRQGKRLRAAPLEPPEPDYVKRRLGFQLEPLDYVSLGLVVLVAAILWTIRAKLVTFAPDGYYHLLVARRIAEDGLVMREHWWQYFQEGIVPRWDWWEYAPQGRPHLYPPLLHILIAVFSLPFGKDVAEGMRIMQVCVPALVFLSTWYLARWFFDARRGFLAMLLVGVNMFFALLALWALPSILANAFVPLLLVLFLTRRYIGASLLMALILYTHMGVGPLTMLGLFLFALWRREYLWFFAAMALTAIVLALPWYGHVWFYRDWLGNPLASAIPADFGAQLLGIYLKMKWLLMVDLLIVLLVIRAWRMIPWFETRYKLLLCNLLGFLPMFFEYGGRFFFHTLQVWAILAVVPLVRFLSPPLRVRRVALFIVLAFVCPPLILAGNEGSLGLRIHPVPSGWTMMAVVAASGNVFAGEEDEQGNLSYGAAVELGAHIKRVTAPDQILHVVGHGEYKGMASLAVTLGYHADRRIDTAAWPEVRPADPDQAATSAADLEGCFISRDPDAIPEGLVKTEAAGFYVGTR